MRERMESISCKIWDLETSHITRTFLRLTIVWLKDLHKFIISICDFPESFEIETELAWTGILDKWEVKESYHQHMPNVSHGAMTTDERKPKTKRVSKICLDDMYIYWDVQAMSHIQIFQQSGQHQLCLRSN